MRLNELIHELDQALVFALFETQLENTPSGQVFTFLHAPNVRAFLNVLGRTGIFDPEVTALKDNDVYALNTNTVKVAQGQGTEILKGLGALKERITLLSKTLKEIRGKETEDENSIYLKIPAQKDFEELSQISHELQIIFGQIIYEEPINGKLEIQSAESGSIWFYIYLATAAALSLISNVVRSAIVIRNENQRHKYQTELWKQQKAKTEMLENLLAVQKEEIRILLEMEANHVYDESFSAADEKRRSERIIKLRNSILELSKMIEKGVVVQPSLAAPIELKGTFPNMKNLSTVFSSIKQIGNSEKSENPDN